MVKLFLCWWIGTHIYLLMSINISHKALCWIVVVLWTASPLLLQRFQAHFFACCFSIISTSSATWPYFDIDILVQYEEPIPLQSLYDMIWPPHLCRSRALPSIYSSSVSALLDTWPSLPFSWNPTSSSIWSRYVSNWVIKNYL